jgi:hypothetical protein
MAARVDTGSESIEPTGPPAGWSGTGGSRTDPRRSGSRREEDEEEERYSLSMTSEPDLHA